MKPVRYKALARILNEWAKSDDDFFPEDIEPQALAWVLENLGRERDEATELLEQRDQEILALRKVIQNLGGKS